MRTISYVLTSLAAIAAASATPAAAQQVNVHWDPTTEDALGTRLASAVQQQLADSGRFYLTDDTSVSAVRAYFVTQDPDEDTRQIQTTYSLVITLHFRDEDFDRYLTNFIGICGTDRVPQCAQRIVGNIDRYAQQVRSRAAQ